MMDRQVSISATTDNQVQSLRIPLLLTLTILIFLGVRLLDLDRLVTTDEPFWLGRSANFYHALSTGDFEHTYQMAHPGVMTMWAGAFAYLLYFPEYADLATGNMEVPYGIENQLRNLGQDPLQLMIAAKVIKVILQSLFFATALFFLQKLILPGTAALTGLLIAFSPMMSGLDSALHVDGLFTTICFAAIVLICWASFGRTESQT